MFGSSRSVPGEAEYAAAYELGKLLVEAGYEVCSGGYSGAMEAVSRGAREAGGRPIGITVEIIKHSGNEWLDQELRAESIFHRIERMLAISQGCVALRGGSGTLAEIALTLNLLLLGALEPRPLVLVGPDWQAVMDNFFAHMPSTEDERSLLTMAESPAEAVTALASRIR